MAQVTILLNQDAQELTAWVSGSGNLHRITSIASLYEVASKYGVCAKTFQWQVLNEIPWVESMKGTFHPALVWFRDHISSDNLCLFSDQSGESVTCVGQPCLSVNTSAK